MNILSVTKTDFRAMFPAPLHAYNDVAHAALNAHKVERTRYLLFVDEGKTRFGIILGERNGRLLSPFSAPFGGFVQHRPQSLRAMEEAVTALKRYAAELSLGVEITLPPLVYDVAELSKWVNVLSRRAAMATADVNYHYALRLFPRYVETLERRARNKLAQAMSNDFTFITVDSRDSAGAMRAYDVIRRNRAEHSYPLRMTYDEVTATSRVVPTDFFLLCHDGRDVAAAQVFHVADGVVQVIYWGDIGECSHLRTMNMLAFRIFEHYHNAGIRIVDTGTASTDGKPNHGLCEFKESIGCTATNKFSFIF